VTYRVRIKRSAEKEIRSLPEAVRRRIHRTILRLSTEPRPQGVRKLRGVNAWRVRVGEYRLLYLLDDGAKEITVILVKHRREVYR